MLLPSMAHASVMRVVVLVVVDVVGIVVVVVVVVDVVATDAKAVVVAVVVVEAVAVECADINPCNCKQLINAYLDRGGIKFSRPYYLFREFHKYRFLKFCINRLIGVY